MKQVYNSSNSYTNNSSNHYQKMKLVIRNFIFREVNSRSSSNNSAKSSTSISDGEIGGLFYHTNNVADKNNTYFDGSNSKRNAIVNNNNIKDENITLVKNICLILLQIGACVVVKLGSF